MRIRANSALLARPLLGSVLLAALAAMIGCGPSSNSAPTSTPELPVTPDPHEVVASLQRSGNRANSAGVDLWEVALCRIPELFDDALYDMEGVRLEKSATSIVDELGPVSDYFERWSSGEYSVEFRPALGDLFPVFGSAQACIDAALEQSSAGAEGVLVVADAQHLETRIGGWGSAGEHCESQCGPIESKRYIYMGAADFVRPSGSWLDLVEHELGHALGWPHSRRTAGYDSALDVMSDSSAGRRSDATRVHAPGVLAVNRFLAGWLDEQPLVLGVDEPVMFEVTSDLFAIVVVSRFSVLAVEVIDDDGDYDHVNGSGVAVHLVEWGPDACDVPTAVPGEADKLCAGTARSHRSIAPDSSTDGLMRAGDRVEFAGLDVVVESIELEVATSVASIRVAAQ